ncbi:MAG: sigma 54-interacting transcriptional regulator, partial [Rhodopirellula sp.]|nr:sigma 54-interacting transcriptional regulator [Rhodopirellula sp.]
MMELLLEPFSTALENDRRLRETEAMRAAAEADKQSLLTRLGRKDLADVIVGANSGLRAVMERVELVARSDVPVLILGETGTGKELVARVIHTQSPRSGKPFLRVNCGAIPMELIDSQLFGHERGAFTGAVEARQGWFERADGGTLLLDEIGELPLAAQVRLLRILQDGWLERVGGHRPINVDVRIVAATHRDLAAMVTQGKFREDLWYRIAVFPILLPTLRERPEDIPELARHFAERAASRFVLPLALPSAEDVSLLMTYGWPG